MDWPEELKPYQSDCYLQNRTSAFSSPLTGTRQVLIRQGARWRITANFRFVGAAADHKALARKMDATLAKRKGAAVTIKVWDFARPTPSGSLLDRSSYPTTFFSDGTTFSDGTGFSPGSAGLKVWGAHVAGAAEVEIDGAVDGTLLEGDYVELGGFMYMLTEDVVADTSGRAYLQLNRPVVATIAHLEVPITTRAKTPMQLVDDDQPARSVGVGQVYEYSVSFVEAFF